jgi:dCTP diphosphatase
MNTASGDGSATIDDLRRDVADFVAERLWRKYHTPKNLAMSLAIEAGELMEHFQWLTPEEAVAVKSDRAQMEAIRDELADCLAYVLSMANALNVDLTTSLREKLKKNAAKYPADQYRGRFRID